MHFQAPPYEQGKLVRAVQGEIIDVAIDIRVGAPTYGKWVSELLTGKYRKMLWVPPGYAHGFMTLTETLVRYKVTKEYNKVSEGGLIWNDASLKIDWMLKDPSLSEKDTLWPTLSELKSPFKFNKD